MGRATGPGKTEIRNDPPSLMLFNFDIDGNQLKTEHETFLRIQVLPTLLAGGSVTIVGFTSRSGSEEYNQGLSEQRAANTLAFLRRVAPNNFNVLAKKGFGERVATREGEADGSENERFRGVLLFLSKTSSPPPPPPSPPPPPPPPPLIRVRRITKREFLEVDTDAFSGSPSGDMAKDFTEGILSVPGILFPEAALAPAESRSSREVASFSSTDRVNRVNIDVKIKFKIITAGTVTVTTTTMTYEWGPPLPLVSITERREVADDGPEKLVKTNTKIVPRDAAEKTPFVVPPDP